jgi:hypothetical protein
MEVLHKFRPKNRAPQMRTYLRIARAPSHLAPKQPEYNSAR